MKTRIVIEIDGDVEVATEAVTTINEVIDCVRTIAPMLIVTSSTSRFDEIDKSAISPYAKAGGHPSSEVMSEMDKAAYGVPVDNQGSRASGIHE